MEDLFGTTNIGLVIAGFFWGAFGIILSLVIEINKRNVKSKRSPEHFSWAFFWRDNAVRIIVSLMCLIAALRFGTALGFPEYTTAGAFLIGLGSDKLVEQFKKLSQK